MFDVIDDLGEYPSLFVCGTPGPKMSGVVYCNRLRVIRRYLEHYDKLGKGQCYIDLLAKCRLPLSLP